MKFLGIYLTKQEDLYNENYKTSLREIKDLYKWRSIPCLLFRKLKMFILSKMIYRFNTVPKKILQAFYFFGRN